MTGQNNSGSDPPSSSHDSSSLEGQSSTPDQTPMPPMDSDLEIPDGDASETEGSLAAPPGATEAGVTNAALLGGQAGSNTIGTGTTIALGCVAAAVVIVFVVILILTIVS